jgi:Acetyltransferase (GNAT) family
MMYKTETLSQSTLKWFVETAGVNMLKHELKRPELEDLDSLYALGEKMLYSGTGWVVKLNDEPVGGLGALLVPNIYNPRFTTLAELFWYVLPEYRNSRAGLYLLDAFNTFAADNADDATLSLLPSSEVRSLEKRGFEFCERAYKKEYTWRPYQQL